MKPVVYERQVEQWTNVQVLGALQSLGFQVSWYPISGRLEKRLGVDAIFASAQPRLIKLFGLQYKVLWQGTPPYWPLDTTQHEILKATSWAYYCLSDMVSMRQAPMALQFGRFHTPASVDRAKSIKNGKPRLEYGVRSTYRRWARFLTQLEDCKAGLRIASQDDLAIALRENTPEVLQIIDAIIVLAWEEDPVTGELRPDTAVSFDRSLPPSDTLISELPDDSL